jgi:hypothetical protein
VTANTLRNELQWRRAAGSFDAVYPARGNVASKGKTSVSLTDVVLDDTVVFEVVDGETVLLRLKLHQN